jgi:hypothetical protein
VALARILTKNHKGMSIRCYGLQKLTLLVEREMQHDWGEALKQQRSKRKTKKGFEESVLPGLFMKN